MAIKRPKKDKPQTLNQSVEEDTRLEFIEQLVEKSLAINPALKKGMTSTQDVVKNLKAEIKDKKQGKTQEQQLSSQIQNNSLKDDTARKNDSIQFFIEQKQKSFQEQMDKILIEEMALNDKKRLLKESVLFEIVDFLALIQGNAKKSGSYSSFFKQLGVTTSEIEQLLNKRKNK